MPLDPGTRLGPYEIVSAIGAGGMGEVYRARNTRLDRDVAINIATIYGTEESASPSEIDLVVNWPDAVARATITH